MFYDGIGDGDYVRGDGVCGDGNGGGFVAFECDRFALGEIEEGDFIVGAGEKNVVVELVNVDDVCILVGVELVSILVVFIGLVVAILQDEAVGVAAEECVFEGLYLIQDWRLVADA